MAFINQEKKKELLPAIKEVLKKYGVKGSVSVKNSSALVVTLKEGSIDFGKGYSQVNHYYIKRNYEGVAQEFLLELKNAMMEGNYDNSDPYGDYHEVGWYIDINVGKWDKPYIYKEV